MQVYFKEKFESENVAMMLNGSKKSYVFRTLDNVVFTINSSKTFTVSCKADMTDEFIKITEGTIRTDEIETKISDEINVIRKRIIDSKNEVMDRLIYMLDWYQIENNHFSPKGLEYSLNGEDFNKITGRIGFRINSYPKHNLRPNTEEYIQRSLLGDYWKPLQAFEYLHKAKRDQNNKHSWINATIAAELAIKEFLINNKPELSILLLEMPSPPLHKLYGKVLESFFGEKSPKVSELHKGASKRNEIIHRPNDIRIEKNEIEKYIKDVEVAIFHLLSLVNGRDTLIDSYLK